MNRSIESYQASDDLRQRCDKLERLVKALESLLTCYRLAKSPSDELLAHIRQLKRDLERV